MFEQFAAEKEQASQRVYGFYPQDPRCTLLNTLILFGAILFVPRSGYVYFTVIAFWIILQMVLTGGSLTVFFIRLLKIYPMIFLMTIMLPFVSPTERQSGDILLSLGNVHIYEQGLMIFADINIRSILLFSASMLLLSASSYTRLMQALNTWRFPKWIAAIMIYMYRFIFIIAEEFRRMHRAYQSRHIALSFRQKVLSLGKISGVYLTRIVTRSERIFMAMLAKGFNGHYPVMVSLKWYRRDSLSLALNTLFMLGIFWL